MLTETFPVPAVSVHRDRCLNHRHVGAGCTACRDVCLPDAVRLDDGRPGIDAERCVRCGACAAVCPTDAIDDPGVSEIRLLQAVGDIDADSVVVRCALDARPSRADAPVVRHGRCLASLTVGSLLSLSRDGSRCVTLDLSHCPSCPLGPLAGVIASTAEAANVLAEVRGVDTAPIRLDGSRDSGEDTDSGPGVIDSRRPSSNRRGMFTLLRRRAVEVIDRSTAAPPVALRARRGPVQRRLPHQVPSSRARLIEWLHAPGHTLREPIAGRLDALPFGVVSVQEGGCSGCGLCARYCPTGALTFEVVGDDGDTTFTLGVSTVMCLDCGICETACPESAITVDGLLSVTALQPGHTDVLAHGQLVRCTGCGLPTGLPATGAVPECFACRLGAGPVTALRDDAGLMADLLSRIPRSPDDAPGTR